MSYDFNESQAAHLKYVEKRLVASNIEHGAVRLASAFEQLRNTAREYELDDVGEWCDAARCAALSAASAAREAKP